MSKNNFYTFEELKDFTNNFTDLTIINVTKFIETKTNKKHTVIERQLVCDLNKQLFDNTIAVFEIQKFLNEIWSKVTVKNNITIDRWKEQLKIFET
jgi:hypothetical protein